MASGQSLTVSVVSPSRVIERRIVIDDAVIAGWTGRDRAADVC